MNFAAITTSKIRVVVSAAPDGVVRLAEVEAWTASSTTANINWLVTDQLGTPRMTFDKTGALANVKRHDYLPFGEELFATQGGRTTAQGYPTSPNSNDSVRQKFTQKERDIETGLDYFEARYYSSTPGRFTSPDEFTGGPDEYYEFHDLAAENPTFYADLTDPQSLNKYQYCYNNPLLYIDLDGHQGVREWFRNTLNGAASTVSENNGFGRMDAPQTTTGRVIGHVISIVQGAAEIYGGASAVVGGGGEAIATSPAAGTVVGALVPAAGVVTAGAGAIVTVHGGAVVVNTVKNIFSKNSSGQQSSGEPPGQTSAGRPTDQNGRPLGPSGKPTIHNNDFGTKKAAKDAARNAGQGAPVKHPSPQKGGPHYHPTKGGKKVPDGTHYNYPGE